ncbi:hypothetical protein AWB80_07367 [Caballeronia pedi]|uniref:Uncharacterized protein n=1 Tax=Caballeronia pedi TaxID=1777141 RepID=A0A158DSB6_9BURK|nr:hypothetical protein [Caballeronia pedi]SAK97512.1 hypothetical protein AWB80_07367 [Caballeronia pedi]
MSQLSDTPVPPRFPSELGASTAWQLSDGRNLTLFVVDSSVPLYNAVLGSLRSFANSDQVTAFVARLNAAPGEDPTQPAWQGVFETGFEQSVDGSRNKRWCLRER